MKVDLKLWRIFLFISVSTNLFARVVVDEKLFVESTVDTDGDGAFDRIYITVSREQGLRNIPAIYTISPYSLGGNDVPNHNVDLNFLPQDDAHFFAAQTMKRTSFLANKFVKQLELEALERGYAKVSAHSVGTGYSQGCPTVGDQSETLAAKSVIDWLGGRAKAFDESGNEVRAEWSNGMVGMHGVSYNGTLPNMVATTGVEGLKAIVPVAAISNWYDYYRANGLVVGPGGYIGEDVDVLGAYIVKKGKCSEVIQQLTRDMGREHGDFSPFWQERNYLDKAKAVKAAVFIMHGQSDWNVRQLHAIQWWEALDGVVPRRMWLHRGGHGYPERSDVMTEIWDWYDHFVKGIDNGVESRSPVEVESPEGVYSRQNAWPHESTDERRFYLNANHVFSEAADQTSYGEFEDFGRTISVDRMVQNPTAEHKTHRSYLTAPLASDTLMSGTPRVQLALSVLNRKAANVSVVLVDYDGAGRGTIVTRGWIDPQNHSSFAQGELLVQQQTYKLVFKIEPKQYLFKSGHKIGFIVTSTDFEHTLRPKSGTLLRLEEGESSFVDVRLSQD